MLSRPASRSRAKNGYSTWSRRPGLIAMLMFSAWMPTWQSHSELTASRKVRAGSAGTRAQTSAMASKLRLRQGSVSVRASSAARRDRLAA